MTLMVKDDVIQIERLELAPWGTNAYIVVCMQTRESAVVDAPAEADSIITKLKGTTPRYLLLTHNHRDHIGVLAELHERLAIPLAAHPQDAGNLPVPPDILLKDGDNFNLGNLKIEVLHTPGHTPGSVCFKFGKYLLAGDTIFPGGPGKTGSPDAFQQIVMSIKQKILVLPGDVQVLSGHGEATFIQKVTEEYQEFASRKHAPNLCGDVLWLSS